MMHVSREEKLFLLKTAREAIENHLKGMKSKNAVPESEILKQSCGAFVTIKQKEKLRGCIGQITATAPLFKTIEEMAISAATKDPRFSPVTVNELPEIDIEISVLSPLQKVSDISEITVGEHGLLIKRLPYQGLLLPQVAAEYNWDREQFLQHTCMKAGLPTDSWKDADTEIELFSAVVFGEKER